MNNLKDIIAALEELRDKHHDQLDASALVKLDDALSQLKEYELGNSEISWLTLSGQVLDVIDKALRLVTNLTDFMN